MKPKLDSLAIVTATTDLNRSEACRASWQTRAANKIEVYVVANGPAGGFHQLGTPHRANPGYLGTVPAFAEGVRRALAGGHEIIACFHDDLLIEEDEWDLQVVRHFVRHPQTGLAGFLGGTGLGAITIYLTPYSPMQLAREGVLSHERNAEAHGERWMTPARVAVLDGFSQIGRRAFWRGQQARYPGNLITRLDATQGYQNLFAEMASWGITHHAYDAALGCFARRLGWEVWMLPVACWHQGGQTAVGDAGYAEWAQTQHPKGDQGFWDLAHAIVYNQFRDVLPVRV